jgi:hypothetical protein
MERIVEHVVTKVIIPAKGLQHTPAGQRKEEICIKAVVFNMTWDSIKQRHLSNRQRTEIFNESIPAIHTELQKYRLIDTNDNILQSVLQNLYLHPERMSALRAIDNYLSEKSSDDDKTGAYHLLFAKEKDIHEAIKERILNTTNIAQTSYVIRILYMTHGAFFDIGREYKWNDQQSVCVRQQYNDVLPVINAGNPLTESTIKAVKKWWKDDVKSSRSTKYIPSLDGEGQSDKESSKHSKPSSIAVVFYIMITLFANIMKRLSRVSVQASEETENMINVLMFYMFLIHEGARGGDTLGWIVNGKSKKPIIGDKGQLHSTMKFSLNGKVYPVLVLAFLKPEHLSTLIQSNMLKKYVVWFWKGKTAGAGKKGEYRARIKIMIPQEQNILDLVIMYIILMRIKLVIAPQHICRHIFKPKQNMSLHFKRTTDKVQGKKANTYYSAEVSHLTPYSIRYAAAEEEVALNIKRKYIQYRMGHTDISHMFVKYSTNYNERGTVNGDFVSKLAWECDIPESDVPYLFCEHPSVQPIPDNEWPDIPEYITKDLDDIDRLIKPLLATEYSPSSSLPEGLLYCVPKTQADLMEELSKIPLGSQFKFASMLLPVTIVEKLQERMDYVHKFFGTVPKSMSQATTPTIYAYPQIIWGDFTRLFEKDVEYVLEEAKESKAPESLQTPKKPKKSKKPRTPKIPVKPIIQKKKKPSTTTPALEGRIVAIYIRGAKKTDPYACLIPNTKNKHVWIGYISEVIPEKTDNHEIVLSGRYFKGKRPVRMELDETVDCVETSYKMIVHSWTPDVLDKNDNLTIPEADLKMMAAFLNANFT